ncbi:MAG: hypothetical protein FWE67_10395 [Planctomycetaceae bacterium]|nr:hypothetical protein [Planctomycetaceae bacterium]
MTSPPEKPSSDAKPEKPPFSQRHPYWSVFFVAMNHLVGLVTIVGFESICRFDIGVLCAYVFMFLGYMIIFEQFVGKKRKNEKWSWKSTGVGVILIAFTISWFCFFVGVARFIPPVTISRETTFLTDPRTDDGWIDFAAGFEQQFLPPIPPEQNGYRTLAAALGKSVCDNEEAAEIYWSALCEKLGLDPNLEPAVKLGVSPFVDRKILAQVLSRPWTMGEFPEVAIWLDEQKPLLEVLAEAVRQEHFVLPAIPRIIDADGDALERFAPELFACYGCTRLRDLGVWLAYRITLHLGSGNEQKALDDIETLYRLASANRVRLNHTMQLLTAPSSLGRLANELSLQWLWTMKPDAQRIAEWEARRKAVIHSAPVSDIVRLQRLCSLNMIKRVADPEFMFDKNNPDFWLKEFNFRLSRYGPWDRHFRDLNRHYDACDTALNRPYRGTLPVMRGLFSERKKNDDFTGIMTHAVKFYLWKGSLGFYISFMAEINSGAMFEETLDMVYNPYFVLAAYDSCTETAFALERFRLHHGNSA